MIKDIAKTIKDLGGAAYYVGGYVRDNLLGIPNKDIDVEVYGLELDELTAILSRFGKVKEVGKSFGVLKLDGYDFSIPRSEIKTGTGHTEFDIKLDPYASFESACSRRDITINAIMQNVLTGEYIDPFDGMYDLRNKQIRHVNDEAFIEDPLRVYRVAGFAARFDFVVLSDTVKLCKQLLPELKTLSAERIYIELEKILMKGLKPSIAFDYLLLFGVLKKYFPELYDLVGLEQGTLYHSEGCAYTHTMLALDYVKKEERSIELMLAILLHDLGKISTGVPCDSELDHISFYGHAEASVPLAETFLKRITNEKSIINKVLPLVENHMAPYLQFKDKVKKKTVRRLILKCDVPMLLQLHRADKCSHGAKKNVDYIDNVLNIYEEIKDEIAPILKGQHLIDHLKLVPGKHFGKILKDVYEAQLDGLVTTIDEGLDYVKKMQQVQVVE